MFPVVPLLLGFFKGKGIMLAVGLGVALVLGGGALYVKSLIANNAIHEANAAQYKASLEAADEAFEALKVEHARAEMATNAARLEKRMIAAQLSTLQRDIVNLSRTNPDVKAYLFTLLPFDLYRLLVGPDSDDSAEGGEGATPNGAP